MADPATFLGSNSVLSPNFSSLYYYLVIIANIKSSYLLNFVLLRMKQASYKLAKVIIQLFFPPLQGDMLPLKAELNRNRKFTFGGNSVKVKKVIRNTREWLPYWLLLDII